MYPRHCSSAYCCHGAEALDCGLGNNASKQGEECSCMNIDGNILD
jgi:hypothetical protein